MDARKIQLPREIHTGAGMIKETGKICRNLRLDGNVMVVTGPNTRKIGGDDVIDSLLKEDYNVNDITIDNPSKTSVEAVQDEIKQCSLVLGVGGGKVIDVAKLASTRAAVNFISVPTAASHDGIASPRASIKNEGGNVSLRAEDELAKEAIHVKGFEEEVYWVTHGGLTELNKKLALRPTSETAMYPMFSLWVRNHSDLPMRYYQVVNTFRYETKHTRPLIRVREITTFKEAHTVHATAEETEEQVKEALRIYRKFFDGLGIPYTVSKRPEWDKFPGALYTMAFDTLLPDGKTLQIGTVHNLGQTFAKTFDITYETAEGDHEYVYQTCYGLSDRVIASVIGVHGDDSGLCLPPDVAPYHVVIVPIIFKKGGEVVLDFCKRLQDKLESELNLRVYFDDRDIRAGKKYYEWEMRGIPLRLEVGPRDIENHKIVTFRRDSKEKEIIDYDDNTISDTVNNLLDNISLNMREKAWQSLEDNVHHVETLEEASTKISEEGGIVTFDWCGDQECGKDIEEKVNVDILGVQADKEDGICINCGKQSKHLTLIAKTY